MTRRLSFRLLVAFSLVWAAWAAWTMMGGATPVTVFVVDDLGLPVPGAEIRRGNEVLGVTAVDGGVKVDWLGGENAMTVAAPGYPILRVPMLGRPEESVEAVLRAQLLRGRVYDSDGRGVEGAYVTANAGTSVSDIEGRFSLRNAQPGTVQVWRPAWEGAVFQWDGGPGERSVTISRETMKSVHISGDAAEERWTEFIELAETTELNSLMLDLKDETGLIFFDTELAVAHEIGAVDPRYELATVVADAERAGIYLIGRIVAYQDPIAAIRAPDMAIWDSATGTAYQSNGQYFLDPTDPAAQAYALDLAIEACQAGLDEIQFDYVRFPDGLRVTAVLDGSITPDNRIAAIRDFLATAVAQLHPLGCAVGADIFGFITRAIDDGGIGQRWEEMTSVVDVASPMLYPSHYASGWYGFADPVEHPAALVGGALDDGLRRLSRQIVVRPWLQDFGYTADQVRAQIEEANSRGLGWMLWNAQSNVTVEALLPEG
ncbi:MAG: putative glycoside hydrolase [Acidimicrobiia bacterium]